MIHFHSIDVKLRLKQKIKIKRTIQWICESNKKKTGDINIIFCSDEYLLGINKQYLNHDYYTDIITFDNSFNEKISGDLFISYDRIKENSLSFHVEPENELKRVVFHGVLHLNGFKDKTKRDKERMTKEEEKALLYYQNL